MSATENPYAGVRYGAVGNAIDDLLDDAGVTNKRARRIFRALVDEVAVTDDDAGIAVYQHNGLAAAVGLGDRAGAMTVRRLLPTLEAAGVIEIRTPAEGRGRPGIARIRHYLELMAIARNDRESAELARVISRRNREDAKTPGNHAREKRPISRAEPREVPATSRATRAIEEEEEEEDSSSSALKRATADPGVQRVLVECWKLLAQRQLAHRRATVGDVDTSPGLWLRTVAEEKAQTFGDAAIALLAEKPDLDPVSLADALAAPATTPAPVDSARDRAVRGARARGVALAGPAWGFDDQTLAEVIEDEFGRDAELLAAARDGAASVRPSVLAPVGS